MEPLLLIWSLPLPPRIPMLAVVGRPCAVNPDARLRAHARAYEWPILDLRASSSR